LQNNLPQNIKLKMYAVFKKVKIMQISIDKNYLKINLIKKYVVLFTGNYEKIFSKTNLYIQIKFENTNNIYVLCKIPKKSYLN